MRLRRLCITLALILLWSGTGWPPARGAGPATRPLGPGALFASEVAKATASDGAAGDEFGYSVSLSGDTAVVGAWRAKVGTHQDQGAAYVFYRNQGGTDQWGQMAKLTAAGGATPDHFGLSVSISGDVAMVGAPTASIGGNFSQGAAYIFYRNQGGADHWGQVRQITSTDGVVGDSFGYSVS